MAGCFLIGLLAATWLGWGVLAGLAFVVGCVLAAWYAVPSGLLTVVVSPPLLFLGALALVNACLLYTSPSPRDGLLSRMPSSA